MAKTDKIVAKAKEKSESREHEVLLAIRRMQRTGQKITFYSVMKETGASKSYLYTNKTIRSAIEDARGALSNRSPSSKDAIIRMQTDRIKELELEINRFSKEVSIEKYQALLAENEELRKQLKVAYKHYGNT